MDPNATLEAITTAAIEDDETSLYELFDALHTWLVSGGFYPTPATATQAEGLALFDAYIAARI